MHNVKYSGVAKNVAFIKSQPSITAYTMRVFIKKCLFIPLTIRCMLYYTVSHVTDKAIGYSLLFLYIYELTN